MQYRERWLRTLRYESVDHPPVSVPGPWPAARKRWEAEGLPEGVDLLDYWGIERQGGFRSVKIETLFCPHFDEVILEEHEDYVIKINRRGVKERNFPDGSSMPEFLEYPIKGRESLAWLAERMNAENPDRIDPDWLAKAEADRASGSAVFSNGGMYFAFLNEHMGTEDLLTTYYDDPEFVHLVNELVCQCCEKALATCLPKFKLDAIAYHEDMGYKTAPLISPAMFKEFMVPYYKRIQKFADQYGIDIQYMDSDGNCIPLIPLWLDCGINLLSPMEIAAGMDPVRLRAEFGRELRMAGGFDKRILAAGPRQIDAELERLRPVVEDGGYIVGIDHGTPPDVSFANACHYVESLKVLYGMK